jgi:hypothetical protein
MKLETEILDEILLEGLDWAFKFEQLDQHIGNEILTECKWAYKGPILPL